ncbi:MAG: thiamine-phosphate pyrophosphorylase [Sulfurovum sp. AS07-7]|nr:MAG: thiamine-phosphate pyrophosphorylase [Sulfurovum sp. AS07-7]
MNKDDDKTWRLVDANLNRLKEGIRVIEDIARYLNDDASLASKLKNIRHKCKIDNYANIIKSRDSVNDVLKTSTSSEMQRSDINSILIANYKRTQESARVLEEIFKIFDPMLSDRFKKIRYELYTLEKNNLTNL